METTMHLRTPADLGALIRHHRIKLGLNQSSLAKKVGVSRQWLIELEKGKPRAGVGLVLRTLHALGLLLDVEEDTPQNKIEGIDIDAIVNSARKKHGG